MSDKSKHIIVIGYGNSLRSDDGVGQKVADIVAALKLSALTSLCVHQLTPELAAFLANAKLAIFIDACFTSVCEDVQVSAIAPTYSAAIAGHTSDPRSLLALTQVLYNCAPISWWVQIPGANFELGDRLSFLAQRGIQAALEQINYLIKVEKAKLCTKLE